MTERKTKEIQEETRAMTKISQQVYHNLWRAALKGDYRFLLVVTGKCFDVRQTLAGIMEQYGGEIKFKTQDIRYRILYVSPETGGVHNVVWRETQRMVGKASCIYKNKRRRKIITRWGQEILVRSARQADALVGDGLNLLVMNGCEVLGSRFYEALRPSLSTKYRCGRGIFTAKSLDQEWFKELYLKEQDTSLHIKTLSFEKECLEYTEHVKNIKRLTGREL